MAEIRIESKPVQLGVVHLYLVFVDDSGFETVVRGGPELNPPTFGSIKVELGIPMSQSEDNRPVENRDIHGSTVLDLDGRNPENVWDAILQAAQQIQDADVNYDFLTQNSNSLVAAVLERVGINIAPGNDNHGVANTIDQISYKLSFVTSGNGVLASHDDRFVGGDEADVLIGGNGADHLSGGKGADVIILGNIDGNNSSADPNDLVRERIAGGSGTDYLVVTGAEGSKITVSKGDAGDRLLVHASLFVASGESSKIPMFLLTGGVIRNKYSNLGDADAANDINSYYEIDPVTGEQVIRYPFETTEPYSFESVIEYYQYAERLEIRIYDRSIFDGEGDIQNPKQKIVIENFVNGDYGIQLLGPIAFYEPDFDPSQGDLPPPLDGVAQEAYDKALALLRKDLLTYSLDADTGGISGQNRLLALTEPTITVENLMMALDGTAGDDRLQGNDVSELISGGDGNDRLIGKGGDDRIRGDVGDDVLEGGTGADVLDGGDGIDRVIYRRSATGVTINLALGIALGGDAVGDTLIDVEYVVGSDFADTITGDGNVNHLIGEAGDDVLDGGGEDDVLVGGLGRYIDRRRGQPRRRRLSRRGGRCHAESHYRWKRRGSGGRYVFGNRICLRLGLCRYDHRQWKRQSPGWRGGR